MRFKVVWGLDPKRTQDNLDGYYKDPSRCHFMDSPDGKGIEVWMGLPEEQMKLLERMKSYFHMFL